MYPCKHLQWCYVLWFWSNTMAEETYTTTPDPYLATETLASNFYLQISTIIPEILYTDSTDFLKTDLNTATTITNVIEMSNTSTIPNIGVLSINVTAVNSHVAYIEFTSFLQSFFACLCGTSYQCRIPLTYLLGSNYNYDTGDVEQSGISFSNESLICGIEEINLLQSTTALNCNRGLPPCDNCGHFNFKSSQCNGRSTQVKWVSTQLVTLKYDSNIVNITCGSSNVKCVPSVNYTITTPTASSDTAVKSSVTYTTNLTYAVKTIVTNSSVNKALAAVVACLSLVIAILLIVVVILTSRLSHRKQQESELQGTVSRTISVDKGNNNNEQVYSTTEYNENTIAVVYSLGKEDGDLSPKISPETECSGNIRADAYSVTYPVPDESYDTNHKTNPKKQYSVYLTADADPVPNESYGPNPHTNSITEYSVYLTADADPILNESSDPNAHTCPETEYSVNQNIPIYSALDPELMSEESQYLPLTTYPKEVTKQSRLTQEM